MNIPTLQKSCSVLTVTTGAYAERLVSVEEWRKAYVFTIGFSFTIQTIIKYRDMLKKIVDEVAYYNISIDGCMELT